MRANKEYLVPSILHFELSLIYLERKSLLKEAGDVTFILAILGTNCNMERSVIDAKFH